jgi:hypothetical protein
MLSPSRLRTGARRPPNKKSPHLRPAGGPGRAVRREGAVGLGETARGGVRLIL